MSMELLNEVISSYVKQLLKHVKETSDNGQASSQKLYLQIELQLAKLQDFPVSITSCIGSIITFGSSRSNIFSGKYLCWNLD